MITQIDIAEYPKLNSELFKEYFNKRNKIIVCKIPEDFPHMRIIKKDLDNNESWRDEKHILRNMSKARVALYYANNSYYVLTSVSTKRVNQFLQSYKSRTCSNPKQIHNPHIKNSRTFSSNWQGKKRTRTSPKSSQISRRSFVKKNPYKKMSSSRIKV